MAPEPIPEAQEWLPTCIDHDKVGGGPFPCFHPPGYSLSMLSTLVPGWVVGASRQRLGRRMQ